MRTDDVSARNANIYHECVADLINKIIVTILAGWLNRSALFSRGKQECSSSCVSQARLPLKATHYVFTFSP